MKKIFLFLAITILCTNTQITCGLWDRAERFLQKIDETFEPVKIKETETHIIIELQLPGYKKENIRIIADTQNKTLEIKAKKEERLEHKRKTEAKDIQVQVYEKKAAQQEFYKQIPLPKNIQVNTITPEYDNDLLTITFEKKQQQQAEKIHVEVK